MCLSSLVEIVKAHSLLFVNFYFDDSAIVFNAATVTYLNNDKIWYVPELLLILLDSIKIKVS